VQDGGDAVGVDHDALAEPPQPGHGPIDERGNRRIEGADQERCRDADPGNPLAEHPRPKRVQVEFDVRQFGHGSS
jgi:hypothetical protein